MSQEIPPYFEEKLFSKFSFRAREWIVSVLACTAGGAFLIAYFQMGPRAAAYAQTEEAFAKWEAVPGDENLYLEMKKALKQTPALEEKYEAPIAQHLLNEEKVEEALFFAMRSLGALREEAPFHAAYGETSLLIEQKNYQEALEKAVSLKEQMAHEWDLDRLAKGEPLGGGAILYAQNLLRIAFLQKELGNSPGESAAWKEVEAFLEKGPSIAQLVRGNFQEKEASLSNYITERKKELNTP